MGSPGQAVKFHHPHCLVWALWWAVKSSLSWFGAEPPPEGGTNAEGCQVPGGLGGLCPGSCHWGHRVKGELGQAWSTEVLLDPEGGCFSGVGGQSPELGGQELSRRISPVNTPCPPVALTFTLLPVS